MFKKIASRRGSAKLELSNAVSGRKHDRLTAFLISKANENLCYTIDRSRLEQVSIRDSRFNIKTISKKTAGAIPLTARFVDWPDRLGIVPAELMLVRGSV